MITIIAMKKYFFIIVILTLTSSVPMPRHQKMHYAIPVYFTVAQPDLTG